MDVDGALALMDGRSCKVVSMCSGLSLMVFRVTDGCF